MPDLRDLLDAEARRIRGEGTLGSLLRRAARRRLIRRMASGALALAIAGAGFGLAFAAFRLSGGAGAAGQPVPGPSVTPTPTSDEATPAPLRLRLLNGTRVETLTNSTLLRLESEGIDHRNGGYQVIDDGFARPPGRTSTAIFCPSYLDAEARRLRDWLFSGAEIHGAIPNDRYGLTVILGEDFASRNERQTAAYALLTDFIDRRARGTGAEELLSEEATALFQQRYGGLSLYGSTTRPGAAQTLVALMREADRYRAIVRIATEGSDRTRHEQLLVAPGPAGASDYPDDLLIVYAERNE